MVAKYCEYTKNHWITQQWLKWILQYVNFVLINKIGNKPCTTFASNIRTHKGSAVPNILFHASVPSHNLFFLPIICSLKFCLITESPINFQDWVPKNMLFETQLSLVIFLKLWLNFVQISLIQLPTLFVFFSVSVYL